MQTMVGMCALHSESATMSAHVQMRFVIRIAGLLGSPMVNDGIRGRWMSYLQQMDTNLANQVGILLLIRSRL